MNRLSEPTRLTLYVDGSCDGNQNVDSSTPAGWGVVVVLGDSGLGRGSGEILTELSGPVSTSPKDENFIGAKIEQLWEYTEKDGTVVPQWCQGTVVAVKKNSRVHIKWDKLCLREGDPEITQEKFMETKWNKQVNEAWRMNLEC